MIKSKKNHLLFLLLFLCFSSCYKENITDVTISPDYNPTYAVPVGKLSFVLSDVIFTLDSAIKQYDDSLLYVQIGQPLFSFNSTDLFPAASTSLPSTNIPVPTTPFNNNDQLSVDIDPISIQFGAPTPGSAYIDSIIVNSGKLNISISSTGISPADIQLTFPGIIRQGNSLVVNAALNTQGDYSSTTNLNSGDKINYTTIPGNNQFPVNISLTVYASGRSDFSGNISISFSITDIDYRSIHGYLGRSLIQAGEYNIPLTVFELMPENAQIFQEPALRILFSSSIGAPMNFFFNNLQFTGTSTVNLSGSGVPSDETNSFALNYPANINDNAVITTLEFNSENSNLADAFHISPNQIIISPSVYLNQYEFARTNFIKDESVLKLSLDAELPLAAKIQEFMLGDTIALSFHDFAEDITMIEEINLNTTVYNSFPTDAELSISLLDANFRLLKTLDQTNLLESGSVVDGEVIEATKVTPVITLDKSIIQQFENTQYLSFSISIHTVQEGNVWVKFYSYHDIKLILGVKAKLNINLDEL